jgi:GDPmannose 4,6-dehydratase
VRDFVEAAFNEIDVNIEWQGTGVDEVGIDSASGKTLIEVDQRYFRPTEVETLLGNPAKSKRVLGWEATTSLQDMVSEMVVSDLKDAEKDELLRREGHHTYRYFE